MADRNMYVVWSGGCDSTYLLDEWVQYASHKNPLRVISFKPDFMCGGQLKNEAKARESIKKIYADKPVNFLEVETKIHAPNNDFRREGDRDYGLGQVTFWIGTVLPFLNDGSDLYFGYIKGDDFWHYRHYVDEIIHNMAKINGYKDITLKYPLEWYAKEFILEELKRRKLLDFTWYCEDSATNKPCGTCYSCKTHERALYFIKKSEESQKLPDPKNKKIKADKIPKKILTT